MFVQEDVSVPFGLILAPKDDTEVALIKTAAGASCGVWTKHLRTQIIEIVDAEKVSKYFVAKLASQETHVLNFYVMPGI